MIKIFSYHNVTVFILSTEHTLLFITYIHVIRCICLIKIYVWRYLLQNSDNLAAGNIFNKFQLDKLKISLGICYDIYDSQKWQHYTENKVCLSNEC